jgi:membrane-associated phospholipid phosphatase
MPHFGRAALATLAAALAVAATLRWWLPLDEQVFLWVQFHRSCRLDAWAGHVDPMVRGLLAALLIAALARRDWWQPRRFAGLVALFLVGVSVVEVLKTAFERLRPNSTPTMVSGNSFPSGHTTGAAMAAAIAVALIHARNWPRHVRWTAYAIASGCVLLQAAGRLVNGSHWLSDVVGSTLFGIAWVMGAQALRRIPRGWAVGLLAALAVSFLVFDDLPGIRLRLPSALDENRPSLAAVEFGTTPTGGVLLGEWREGPAEPIGPVSWALAPDVGVRFRAGEATSRGMLKLTLRPFAERGRHACSRMVMSVNDWSAPEIRLMRGWREYHIVLPPGVLQPGENTVRFQIEPPGRQGSPPTGLAAFRYLRLYPPA